MLISVVIPTCRRNDLLARCLRRLAPGEQSLGAEQYEVIVSDDGQLQTAEAMVRAEFPWARWRAGPQKGPAANRNAGAAAASGDWIAFTDDDCVPSSGWLAAFVDALAAADVLEGKTTCDGGIPSPLYQAPINLTGGWLWSCNMAVRADCFAALGGFDTAFPHAHMEDTDFRERLKTAGVPFVFVPDAIVDHPPRRVPRGLVRSRMHESEVVYWRKWRQPVRPLRHLMNIVRDRVKGITRHRLSGGGAVYAAWSLVEEVTATALRYPKWLYTHRNLSKVQGRKNG